MKFKRMCLQHWPKYGNEIFGDNWMTDHVSLASIISEAVTSAFVGMHSSAFLGDTLFHILYSMTIPVWFY